jgi:hypothetical protein
MENCVNGLLGVIYYTDTRPEAIIVYSPHVYHNYIIICILLKSFNIIAAEPYFFIEFFGYAYKYTK